jgi:hypothetical protein
MRRPLVPPPNRPNPTDPGDAADLSIPQGYQRDRRHQEIDNVTGPRPPMDPSGRGRLFHHVTKLAQPLRKSTISLVKSGSNPVSLKR